jgi:serine O-acetyltransferase
MIVAWSRRLIVKMLFPASAEVLYERARENFVKGGLFRYYSFWVTSKIVRTYGCHLSPRSIVGCNFTLKHPIAVVIGDGVVIGDYVSIFQSVTLGAANEGEGVLSLYPNIGNGVTIFAGSIIVGNIKIGNNVVIGANSVVLCDVPANCTVAGSPAKVIKRHSK